MRYQRDAILALRELRQPLQLPAAAPVDDVMALRGRILDAMAGFGLDVGAVTEVEPHALANSAPVTLLVWGDDRRRQIAAYVIPNDRITPAQRAALEAAPFDLTGSDRRAVLEAALAGAWAVFFTDDLAAPMVSPDWVNHRFTAAYPFLLGDDGDVGSAPPARPA